MKKISVQGFTLLEILIALAIVVLLLGIGSSVLINYRTAKQLDTTTDSLVAKLEEAKTDSISGKSGVTYGIAITPNSYVYWSGATYSATDPNNVIFQIPSNFTLTTTLSGSSTKFARITGIPSATGTITLTYTSNASTTHTISIGTLGDISVIK